MLCVVLPAVLALLAIGGAGFVSAYREAQGVYDAELSHVAGLMLSLLRAEDQEETTHAWHDDDEDKDAGKTNPDIIELGNDFARTGGKKEERVSFRIWKNGKLLFYSRKAADFGKESAAAGFSDRISGGKEWRFYVLRDAGSGYTLEVAQKLHVRRLLVNEILATIFSPLAFALPAILLIAWFGLRAGLKPLRAVSEAVGNRSALDLTPLPDDWPLAEITPLIGSLNGLLANLDYALNKERRFTDFAAHELRTPIAVLKTQAQTALKSTDAEERHAILEAQVRAADRAAAMVDQLLALARLEHVHIPDAPFSLNDAARDAIREKKDAAMRADVTLRFDPQTAVYLRSNKDLIGILLSNLIENAIKYTPPQGEVTVGISRQDRAPTLCVADTGPGIPEDRLPYVTEPFYRGAGHKQPGAGLGLAIVKRAAGIVGATLILRNRPGGGFEAVVRFPPSAT
ncbi:MAG: sensor histidine kinase N-terminal domain-containing protein [Alphaproteobacteria bacterium]|nr:sensor histidine kinase N-terminal domain-containing protein [Alphaproteobacteria bacterium]